MAYLDFGRLLAPPFRLHPSEQYFTSSQHRSHFFRQVKGRWQTGQSLVGRGPLRGGMGGIGCGGMGDASDGAAPAGGGPCVITPRLPRGRPGGRGVGCESVVETATNQTPKNLP